MTRLKIETCPNCGRWVLTLDGQPVAEAEDPFALMCAVAGEG